MKPKISFSIADLPFNIPIEECFSLASELKVDGIELVLAGRTRFFQKEIDKYVEKYSVPILSIHQPPWSFLGIWYDENMFEYAAAHHASINFHPLKDYNILGRRAEHFFDWMQKKSIEYNVSVMIENMPIPHAYIPYVSVFFLSVCHPSTADFHKLAKICQKYDFGFTLDTDHLRLKSPELSPEFKLIQPYLHNVHISSFDDYGGEHLPLQDGILKSSELLQSLKKQKYSGLLTLELTPHYFYDKEKYFEGTKRSIEIMRKEIL